MTISLIEPLVPLKLTKGSSLQVNEGPMDNNRLPLEGIQSYFPPIEIGKVCAGFGVRGRGCPVSLLGAHGAVHGAR